MRFRTPEIFLGALLTVAIFAMGMLFASSRPESGNTGQSAQQAETHSKKTKSPDDELTGSTWLTKDAAGFFTFWLVPVGIAQVVLFFVQLRFIRMSLDDTKLAALAAQRAAKATEDAVDLSRETAQRQLRAYLFIEKPRVIVFNVDRTCIYELFVKNSGVTPAHDVVVVTNDDFFDLNPTSFPAFEEPETISRSTVSPGGEVVLTPESKEPLTAALIQSVASGSKAFFIWGQIRYVDVFNRQQTTDFRLKLVAGSASLVICEEGNHAT